MQETQVPSLGQEGPLNKEMATHSSVLAWEILWQLSLARYSPLESDITEATEPQLISQFPFCFDG